MTKQLISSPMRIHLLLTAAPLALGLAGPAWAQGTPADSEPQAAAEETVDPGEIIVTARNRAEKLQDVPLAITAFTGEQLEAAGVRNLRDIVYQTPGVTINSGGGEAYTQPIIRGIVNLNGGASDPNVAVFLDGVYVVNNSAISVGLIDIDRVEIVKGPVSTLYGHNGFAGAINYVTKRPGDDYTGRASATVGNDGQLRFIGSVSGPVAPGILSLGIAGGYEKYDGGYKDKVNGLEAGGYKKKDVRASFSLTPTDSVSLYGGLYYGKDHFDTVALVYAIDNCGPLTGSVTLGESPFSQYCGRLKFQPLEVSPVKPAAGAAGNDREVYSGSLHLDVDLGFATASAIGGYNKVTQQRFEDFIGRRTNLRFALTPVLPGSSQVSAAELFGGDSNNKDHSVELRLTSKQDQRFRWALGGYYYKNKFTTSTLIGVDKSGVPVGQAIGGTGGLFATAAGQFSTTNLTLVNGTDEQKSVFASTDIDLFENLTLNGEIRYTDQKKSQDILRNAFVANTVRPFGPARRDKDNFVNYRVSARYKLSQDVTAYASVASGTKAFGFNSRATAFPGEISFGPEYATAYEVGAKASIARELSLDLAVFQIDTRNLQAAVPSSDPKNTGTVTQNLGGTRAQGFEASANISPAPWLRFNFGVGYVDAKFRGGARDFGSAFSCAAIPSCAPRIGTTTNVNGGVVRFVDLDGLKVQRVSPWTVSLGTTLKGDFTEDLSWSAHADFRLEDSQFMAANNYSFWGDRTLVNLRAGIEYQRFSLTAFVDNLTKNRTVESASGNTRLNDFQANPVGFLPIPRRFGLTAGYEF